MTVFSGVVRTGPDKPSLTVYPRRGMSLLLLIVGITLLVPFGYVTATSGSVLDTLNTRMFTLAFACIGVALCFRPIAELFRRDPVLIADERGIEWAVWAQPARFLPWRDVLGCTQGRRKLPRGGWVSYVQIDHRGPGGQDTVETMLLAIRVGVLATELNALLAHYSRDDGSAVGASSRRVRPKARSARVARRVSWVTCVAFFPLWFGSPLFAPAAPIKVGPAPIGIAVTPDGRHAYVANSGFTGIVGDTVSVIDTGSNEVTATVRVVNGPQAVAVSPDGRRVYVTSYGTGMEWGTVSVIDTASNRVITTVRVGYGPRGVVVAPDGRQVYVADFNSSPGAVSVIDTATDTVTATITLGTNQPWGLAITPDGRSVYVTDQLTNGRVGDTVSVIDTATRAVTASITVGGQPTAVALAPDGRHAYVSNFGAMTDSAGTVSVIDTTTGAITATVPVGYRPRGLALTPDGRQLFVAVSDTPGDGKGETGSVAVIDTANNTVTRRVTVENIPNGVAITPDGRRAYVSETAVSGVAVLDTGAGSLPPHGLIWL